jgi:hypothetical protein
LGIFVDQTPGQQAFLIRQSAVPVRSGVCSFAPGSAWQNGVAERLIASIRGECADHIIAR